MKQVYEFGDFRADPAEQLLLHHGQPVPLPPKVFETLLILLNSEGRLIDKDEFIGQLWPEVFVEEVALAQNISQLRRALTDGKNGTRIIQTVPKRGYRMLVPVIKLTVEEQQDVVKLSQKTNGGAEPKMNGAGATPPPAKQTVHTIVDHEARESAKRIKSGKMLVPGLIAAALGILVVGFLFLRLTGKHRGGSLVAEQRVTSNPPEAPVRYAIISPDGKYIVYSNATGLYLRQIDSGETRPWVLPKDFDSVPNSWFPDGTHLLVTRLEGEALSRKTSLWKLSLLGGNPQKLMDNAAAGAVSPDGSQIAFLPGPVGPRISAKSHFGYELWLMASDGGNARKIAESGKADQPNSRGSWIFPVVWSPNGQRLAYIEQHGVAAPEPAADTFSLRTLDVNGGDLQVLLKDETHLGRALWWAADGRVLYAGSDDSATERADHGVYSIPVDERTGRATGQPHAITSGEGTIGSLSVTPNGKRLVLCREYATAQAFIIEFDAGSHRWGTPRRLTLDTNSSMAEAWTADSKAVLFVSNRNGTWKLFKQNIDEITAEVLVEGRSIYLPRVSADGSQVLYLAGSKPGDTSFPASLMSKPLAGGPPRLVLQQEGIINYECARSPSTLCIFSKLVGSDLIFVSFDLEHGAGREIVKVPSGYTNWGLSPDGSRLAVFVDRHRIRFISPDTGAAKDVVVQDWALINGGWSADSSTLFMPSVTPDFRPVILSVNEAGKAEVAIEGQPNTNFSFLIQSPDGRRGILEMPTPGDNNAWMVDNF
jgi:DNA-binding winged helix-turn-helix (wHTH) protein/Tol biopolymer transport system component